MSLTITSLETFQVILEFWKVLQDCESRPKVIIPWYIHLKLQHLNNIWNQCRFMQGNGFTGSVAVLADLPLSELWVFYIQAQWSISLPWLSYSVFIFRNIEDNQFSGVIPENFQNIPNLWSVQTCAQFTLRCHFLKIFYVHWPLYHYSGLLEIDLNLEQTTRPGDSLLMFCLMRRISVVHH